MGTSPYTAGTDDTTATTTNPDSDIAIYRAALDLFLSLSWKEHSEQITYIGEGKWKVDASVYINFERLTNERFNPLFCSETEVNWRYLPIVELQKEPSARYLEVCLSDGKQAWIAPDEAAYTFEWMVILGCIVRAKEHGYLDVPEGSTWRPSHGLLTQMFDKIKTPAQPLIDPELFLENFLGELEEKDKSNKLKAEYKRFAHNCPGFELLFVHFVYSWVCLVQLDKNPGINSEVLSVRFTEFHDQYTAYKPIFKNVRKRLKHRLATLFTNHKLTYPLRRVGTSENESFTIYAPEWTMFQPVETGLCFWRRKNFGEKTESYIQIEGKYDPNQPSESEESNLNQTDKAEKRISILATLSEDTVVLRTSTNWDDRLQKTRRRFEIFEKIGPKKAVELAKKSGKEVQHDPTPKEGWEVYTPTYLRPYKIKIGWRARAGRRIKANLAFLVVSLLLIIFLNAYVNGYIGADKYWNNPTLFEILPIVATLSALVYSNLQEQVPYYRNELMLLPKRLVWVGLFCDMVAFFFGLAHGYFPTAEWFDPCVAKAAICLVTVLVSSSVLLLLLWYAYNGERYGLNGFDFVNKSAWISIN